MKYQRKFTLKMKDGEQTNVLLKNASYRQVKAEILKLVENVNEAWFADHVGVSIYTEDEMFFDYVTYTRLVSSYVLDNTEKKQAFNFMLDALFIAGEWQLTGRTPKALIEELLKESLKK